MMATAGAGEDTELRDLVLAALERSGSLAKIRALLRANVLLAFEQEREPRAPRHNPALDGVLRSREGELALALVAELLEFCNLKNAAYVYAGESRQGRGYRYAGRRDLLQRLAGDELAAEREPLLVSLLRRVLSDRRRKRCGAGDQDGAGDDSPNGNNPVLKKDDDNCTYIVHDDSGSVASTNRSQSDNSTDEKNKLLLRLPLDNSDTDTSSDSARDKTRSEYIPNENIQLDLDSEEENKNLHLILSPKSYVEEKSNNLKSIKQTTTVINEMTSNKNTKRDTPSLNTQNMTYHVDDQMNIMNSSDSTSYLEIKTKPFLPKSASNGEPEGDYSLNDYSIQDISENIEEVSQQKSGNINNESLVEFQTNSATSKSSVNDNSIHFDPIKVSPEKSSEKQTSSKKTETKSEIQTYDYSDDFSPIPESNKTSNKMLNKHASPKSTDSESIQEDISLNGSEKQASSDSPKRKQQESSRSSSISISDIQDLIENSARSPLISNPKATQHKSVIMKNSNVDENLQRMSFLQARNDQRMSSTKNSSDEISDSPIQSLSNISMEFHSE